MARTLPSLLKPVETYEEFVCVYLNLPYAEAANIVDMSDAVEIGMGKTTIPHDWIDLLTEDEIERAKWRLKEFRKTL